MQNYQPTILGCAAPVRTNQFAQLPLPVIILVAVLVPGLSSSLIRGSALVCLSFFAAFLAAFRLIAFVWEMWFPFSSWGDVGVNVVFIILFGTIEIFSVMWAIGDTRKALTGALTPTSRSQ
jgi:hypothetical protein